MKSDKAIRVMGFSHYAMMATAAIAGDSLSPGNFDTTAREIDLVSLMAAARDTGNSG